MSCGELIGGRKHMFVQELWLCRLFVLQPEAVAPVRPPILPLDLSTRLSEALN